MRILAIRGCNLASLAGEFELDLARDPFGGAGVFAIVGNTGAGKSTLLDALCVALFDRTPRLANHSRVVVGRGDDDPAALGAQDVRTLLRRGAAAGWAEVDFEGGDARRYRARWSVRRARGHALGALQDQQLSLVALDGGDDLGPGPSTGTKTETLKAISARLGLTFDQFRRSALLAQGEFASFLRADGKHRSELLERMTGSEIYSRLSIEAHVRAALVEQRLHDGRTVAQAIAVLGDDARTAGERELAMLEQARAAARTRMAAAEHAERWRREHVRLVALVEQARHDQAAAEVTLAASANERDELATIRKLAHLQPLADRAAQLASELAKLASECDAYQARVDQCRVHHDGERARHDDAAAALAQVRAVRIACGFAIREDEAVDHTPSDLGTELADALEWLTAHRELAPVVATWPELVTTAAQRAAAGESVAVLDRKLATATGELVARAAARELAARDHTAAHAELSSAHREVAQLAGKRPLTLEVARRRDDEARAHADDCERLVAVAVAARQATRALAELTRQLAELDTSDAAERAEHDRLTRALEVVAALRGERARTVDRLQRAASLAVARRELRAGEPCPLCGACDHPGVTDDGTLASVSDELAAAQADHDRLVASLATLDERQLARARERDRLGNHCTTARAALAAASGEWRDQLSTLGELVLVTDPASPAAEQLANEREASARKRLEAARGERQQAEAVATAEAAARSELALRQAAVDACMARVVAEDRALGELTAAVERTRSECGAQRDRVDQLDRELAARLGGRSLDELAPLVERWNYHGARVAAGEAALANVLRSCDRLVHEADRARVAAAAQLAETTHRHSALAIDHRDAAARYADGCAAAGVAAGSVPDRVRGERLAERLAMLDRELERTTAIANERGHLLAVHCSAPPSAGALADADSTSELAAAVDLVDARAAHLAATLAADREARERRAAALAAVSELEHATAADRALAAVIGSHDGKSFRSFAQSLTLDGLLAVANAHLDELAPRYQLERVPRHDLEIQIIDRDLGAEVRSVQSLSGGESFLVSLALALGLSSMSANDVRVRTLLIDEGFGTLDPVTLDSALSVLDELQASGRQVGVISHIPALIERVRAHVQVIQRGGGRSEVIVC